jgi:FMN phosphatase YigB (HAD superfamily)
MKRIVIFDLDGCLSDDEWRRNLLPDFKVYHKGLSDDKPINVSFFRKTLKKSKANLVFLTARPRLYFLETELWIEQQLDVEYYRLIMRPFGNRQSSPEFKTSVVDQLASESDVWAIYDDREDVVSALIKAGHKAYVLKK